MRLFYELQLKISKFSCVYCLDSLPGVKLEMVSWSLFQDSLKDRSEQGPELVAQAVSLRMKLHL